MGKKARKKREAKKEVAKPKKKGKTLLEVVEEQCKRIGLPPGVNGGPYEGYQHGVSQVLSVLKMVLEQASKQAKK